MYLYVCVRMRVCVNVGVRFSFLPPGLSGCKLAPSAARLTSNGSVYNYDKVTRRGAITQPT